LFIEAENPAAVLRQTAEDLAILGLHAPCRGECGHHSLALTGPWCHTCRCAQSCWDNASLARRYGLGGRRD
jgi:hypothetical protein